MGLSPFGRQNSYRLPLTDDRYKCTLFQGNEVLAYREGV